MPKLLFLIGVFFFVLSSQAQTSSCLEIHPNTSNDIELSGFDRQVNVLGVMTFYAELGVTDAQLLHAASIGAELLDNNEDSYIDDDDLQSQMAGNNVIMPIFANEGSEAEETLMDNWTGQFCASAVLYAGEVAPWAPVNWFYDASLEEILHTINACGHVELYPQAFALNPPGSSLLLQAMDVARGGQFLNIPASYPDEAWYHYDDYTCDYECMAIEYLYWAIASNMGVLNSTAICAEIANEWEPCSPALLATIDVLVYELINDPQYKLPSIAPDGIYCPTVGIFENLGVIIPVVSPNPSASEFTLTLNDLAVTASTLKVFDSTGRLVYSLNLKGDSDVMIDLEYKIGCFVVMLFDRDDYHIFSTKLIID